MNYEFIGKATINGTQTSIRKYDNGCYSVVMDEESKYSGRTLKELTDKLDKAKIIYTIIKKP
jgi:ABC-type thiamine transport system substrate-binding protein